MLVVAFVPALVAGAPARRLRRDACSTQSLGVIAVGVHRRRHRDAARRALPAARRSCSTPSRRRSARALGDRRCARRWRWFPACRARARRSSAACCWASIGRRPRSSRSSSRCRRWRRRSCTSCSRCGTISRPSARLEIAIGFVMAFLASLLVVKPFLASSGDPGFAPFAWYRIVARARAARRRGRRAGSDVMQWLRRSFIAGFFVTVPLFISVAALVWIFGIVDGFTTPLLRPAAGPADSRASGIADRPLAVIVLVGRARDQRHRPAAAAARRELAAAGAGVPDDLRAGQAAGRGVFAGQRVRVQARRDGRGSAARLGAGVPDQGVHGRSGPRAGGADGGVRADQPPVSGRHRDLSARAARCFPDITRRGGHPDLPDRRHVAAGRSSTARAATTAAERLTGIIRALVMSECDDA